MSHSKTIVRKHIQMLQCFADAYRRQQLVGAHSLYEFHILVRNQYGNLEKLFRYEIGTSFLPDHASEAYDDLFITLLKEREINNYLEQCKKYGIPTE